MYVYFHRLTARCTSNRCGFYGYRRLEPYSRSQHIISFPFFFPLPSSFIDSRLPIIIMHHHPNWRTIVFHIYVISSLGISLAPLMHAIFCSSLVLQFHSSIVIPLFFEVSRMIGLLLNSSNPTLRALVLFMSSGVN
ncbi:hypothetical protein BDQ12DRAFT_350089 [Crucibulum laeve]|uniref:Uncharacterized protein n=1 Tax=Crucibulum laeve TaxID=68775 RepID=A0A5C3MB71_9AGAR|nr:hypothetical protein BDQ12DRAFT_350089 [Crucibulum laeve]